jgi:hypothetical protein
MAAADLSRKSKVSAVMRNLMGLSGGTPKKPVAVQHYDSLHLSNLPGRRTSLERNERRALSRLALTNRGRAIGRGTRSEFHSRFRPFLSARFTKNADRHAQTMGAGSARPNYRRKAHEVAQGTLTKRIPLHRENQSACRPAYCYLPEVREACIAGRAIG